MTARDVHPCFVEALDLHTSAHAMDSDDYAAAILDLLGTPDDASIVYGLRVAFLALHDHPKCLMETVFLAGVLYGRDYPAGDVTR